MQFHRGRLIDHVHLKVRDLAASAKFYAAVLDALGVPYVSDKDHFNADELWIDQGEPHAHCHLAFQTPDRATVDKVYAAAIAAGGRDNGPPGERPYHPGYYAGFFYDPDGNNLEAVNHGPATRSADSVVFTAG
jgi:catechol 2,3-dioxygenase-like lactoylglutathione lyase family enzyme